MPVFIEQTSEYGTALQRMSDAEDALARAIAAFKKWLPTGSDHFCGMQVRIFLKNIENASNAYSQSVHLYKLACLPE